MASYLGSAAKRKVTSTLIAILSIVVGTDMVHSLGGPLTCNSGIIGM